jgi:hypothetical protein
MTAKNCMSNLRGGARYFVMYVDAVIGKANKMPDLKLEELTQKELQHMLEAMVFGYGKEYGRPIECIVGMIKEQARERGWVSIEVGAGEALKEWGARW